ncbi:MAG: BrnT family toxin [candidate division NC10 bacterium]|nr:BrnT family toxin [candidate division NC10 bacterium]
MFSDPLARIFDDEDHSLEEPREIIIGHSMKRRLLLVCSTARGALIRIFSARQATRRERQDYEENVGS